VELARVEVQLEHRDDDRSPDKIVLSLGGDSNAKTWVTLSGYNISSLKPASDLNRYVSIDPYTSTGSLPPFSAGWSGLWRCAGTRCDWRSSREWSWTVDSSDSSEAG
jgi:hypothetical protein